MMRLDRLYIMFGLAWVVAGMCFGVWVGITGSTNYANSHAHANLLDEVSDHYGMAWSDASRLTLYADFLAETTLPGPWGRFLMARAEEEQSMGANDTNQGSEGDDDE